MKSSGICVILPVLLLVYLLVGCSGSNNPVTGEIDTPSVSDAAHQPSQSSSTNRVLWGFWKITISADRQSVEIEPDRSAAMHLNAVRLLETSPCTDCLTIGNITLIPPNELTADITLRHPFPGLIRYTGFDVRGVFISNADFSFPMWPAVHRNVARGDQLPRILNADGYTQLFNPMEYPVDSPGPPALRYIPGKFSPVIDLSANLNPYIAYRRDAPRRMFEAGGVGTRNIHLRGPDGPLIFGYAVDCCWHPVENVTDPLVDFPPEANCLEAYGISVWVGEGMQLPICGETEVRIEVHDHQGLDTIEDVIVQVPDIFYGTETLDFDHQTGDESWMFTGMIENQLGVGNGYYPLLVRVRDTQQDPNFGEIDAWQVEDLEIIGAHTSDVAWAHTWGGSQPDGANSVAFDGASGILVAGFFKHRVDFDPGDGSDLHVSEVNAQGESTADAYITRFNSSGEYQGVRVWGGPGPDNSMAATVDNAGNVYVTGYFMESVDFDPGDGEDIHVSNGSGDVFLSKFDGMGNFHWARTWGGPSLDPGMAVAVDSTGHVYVAGFFQITADFDPGDGEAIHTCSGGIDACISRFDSSGNFEWVRTWGGIGMDACSGIAIDSEDRAYVTGYYDGEVDFDPGPGEDLHLSEGLVDAYVCRYTSSGDFEWALTWGGAYADECDDVVLDEFDNFYVVGGFYWIADLDPTGSTDFHISHGTKDAYISKFDPSGAFQWARAWGGIVTDLPLEIDVDLNNDIFVTGFFEGTVDFDPGAGEFIRSSHGENDAFLSKFDPSGTFLWAGTWGGVFDDPGQGIAVDHFGNAYVCGYYDDRVDFDPGEGYEIYCTNGMTDCYLSKFPPDGNW